mmetsp:Transcript_28670/g.42573  ORF Transcript_28670/g.42573 Transcript_28670/m.42573 type:complete len:142 (-) Transcript_28670:1026-1451(-)
MIYAMSGREAVAAEMEEVEASDAMYPSAKDQTKVAPATVHKHAAFNAELSDTFAVAVSRRKINMAEAAAAATLHASPILNPTVVPSKESKAVPVRAVSADTHVGILIFRPSKMRAKNGTNFTFKYKRKPDLCAVVNASPTA